MAASAPYRPFGSSDRLPEPSAAGSNRAVAMLIHCAAARRPCLLIGREADQRKSLLAEFGRQVATDIACAVLRLNTPVSDVQSALAQLLEQLGFETRDLGARDMEKLLLVFLRHESAAGQTPLLIVDDASRLGPRLLAFLQSILTAENDGRSLARFVLAGGPELARVVASPAMAPAAALIRYAIDIDSLHEGLRPVSPEATLRPEFNSGIGVSEQNGDSAPRGALQTENVDTAEVTISVSLGGTLLGRRSLSGRQVIAGRGHGCDLRLNSLYVSRRHVALRWDGQSVRVVDLKSSNGTRINGSRIEAGIARPGDSIVIGEFDLKVEQPSRSRH